MVFVFQIGGVSEMESLPISVLFFVLVLDKCPCPVSAPQSLAEVCRAQESDGAPFLALPGLTAVSAPSCVSMPRKKQEETYSLFYYQARSKWPQLRSGETMIEIEFLPAC